MRTRSLTTRFVLTLLLSTALPLLVFGWFARGGMRQRLEQQVVSVLLQDEAGRIAERLDARAEQVFRDCKLIEVAARRALLDRDFAAFEIALDGTPGFHRDFQHVVLVGNDGEVLHRVDSLALDEQRLAASRALRASNLGDQPWFQKTIGEGYNVFWVDRHLSPLLHGSPERRSLDPADYSLGLAFLVWPEDGQEPGVVYALIDWRRFQLVIDEAVAMVREQAGFPGAEGFLCRGDGRVLASSDRHRYGLPLQSIELRDAAAAVGPEPLVVAFDQGEPRLAGVARVGAGDGALQWSCGIDAPRAELFATARDFDRVLLSVAGVIALVLVIWALFASRAILRPVRWLAEATQRIAQGDLSARVPVRGRDELAQLGQAFNDMAADLDASQRQLRAAEREAAWAEMARQVAHEIKNPLTPMRVCAQMVQRAQRAEDPRTPELVDRLTRTVVAQTEQLARIANDFRQFAGLPEPRLELFAADLLLDDVAEDSGALLLRGRPSLVLTPGAEGLELRADRAELRRVFLNLIQNAVAAVGADGRVEVSSAAGPDGDVCFSVRDDGPGIDDEVVERLFEPYFTTRSSGTGLGLAICRRIVESHGGTIRLRSSEPGSTIFEFCLPVAAD